MIGIPFRFDVRRNAKNVQIGPKSVWHLSEKLSIRPATTPAVGVNFILAPNMECFFHVRTAEMAVPASYVH